MSLALIAAIALTASAGCPPTPADQPPAISMNPDWLVKPTDQDIYWAYPLEAVAKRLEGHATITCAISIQGVAENCEIDSEDPEGAGFGEAAVALTSKMLFKPKVKCGRVVPGEVSIPLAFKMPPAGDAPAFEPLGPHDAKLALAARLVALMKYDEMLEKTMDDSGWELTKMMGDERDIPPEEREVLHDAVRATWTDFRPKVMNAMARSYASRMSEQDMTAAIAFFESPAGRQMMDINEGLSEDLGAIFEALEPDMILEFHRRYCEQMQEKCAPDDAT